MTTEERLKEIESRWGGPVMDDDRKWLLSEVRRLRGALKDLVMAIDDSKVSDIDPYVASAKAALDGEAGGR